MSIQTSLQDAQAALARHEAIVSAAPARAVVSPSCGSVRRGAVRLDEGSQTFTFRIGGNGVAEMLIAPGIGLNNVQCLEFMGSVGNTATWFGSQASMQLVLQWNG